MLFTLTLQVLIVFSSVLYDIINYNDVAHTSAQSRWWWLNCVVCKQGRFRALKYGSFLVATSATSSSRSTCPVCSSSFCPGCRSGSTSRRVRPECPSVCWPCWRQRPSRLVSTPQCRVSRTSRRWMFGCRSVWSSCSPHCSNTRSLTS